MEYSPECAIPYVSRVDAGTIELVRQFGVEVASSGDLVQQFSAVWNERADRDSRRRVRKAVPGQGSRLRRSGAPAARTVRRTEFEIQQLMAGWFAEEGLVSDSAPVVAAEKNAGDPHYLPTASATRTIGKDEVLLLDLWGKLDQPGAVFADITWVGYTGREVPARIARAFARGRGRARRGRRSRAAADPGRPGDPRLRGRPRGDRPSCAARATATHILHRTGHSLGEAVHGNGVNMDDYETHDDRRLLPGTGFTIEPGVYFADFGDPVGNQHDRAATATPR